MDKLSTGTRVLAEPLEDNTNIRLLAEPLVAVTAVVAPCHQSSQPNHL